MTALPSKHLEATGREERRKIRALHQRNLKKEMLTASFRYSWSETND